MRAETPFLSAALALACLLLAALPAGQAALLEFDRGAILGGELWRLWTCHAVHFSARHAATDALVLFAAGAIVEREAGRARLACVLAAAAPIIGAGLLAAAPGMEIYRGASGLAATAAVAAGVLLWRTRRLAVAALAVLGAVKLYSDAAGIALPSALPADIAVAWQAHLLGAACGLALPRRAGIA